MITLTPEEADAYERGGLMAAITAFRNRTHLGLVESKRAVEMWRDSGKKIASDGKPSLDEVMMEKLSDALTRLRQAEKSISEQRWAAIEIAFRVMREAESKPQDQQRPWYEACGRVAELLQEELKA